jgi:thiamine-phosphate pyrophosphorylase
LEPLFLLLGLLDEEEGRAAVLLRQAGLLPSVIRRTLAVPAGSAAPELTEASVTLHPQSQVILDHACVLAGELSGENTIAGDHLLLALLQKDEALRGQLVGLGLRLDRVEAGVAGLESPALRLDEPLVLGDPTEEIDVARILDAGANRAREALRVIEDYCRFCLDDRLLSEQLKDLRHQLAEQFASLPGRTFLEARETLRDVGTEITATGERERPTLLAAVHANLKRLQEALRSLEEYAKIRNPGVGQVMEQLRYRSYTLERAILLGTSARARLADARLYVLLTGAQCAASLEWTIAEAAAGGATIFQLREKQLGDRELLERARKVRAWTQKAGALLIMNDRPDIARLVEADGVHVGQDDLPIKEVRRIVGPGALLGVSTHDVAQVRQAVLDGASYIGIGPTFTSGTKDFAEYPGLEFVHQATAVTSLPAFVIGGITLQNLDKVLAAGGCRVTVSQAIAQADEPQAVAAAINRMLQVGAARSLG